MKLAYLAIGLKSGQLMRQKDLIQLEANNEFVFKLMKRSESSGCRQEVSAKWLDAQGIFALAAFLDKQEIVCTVVHLNEIQPVDQSLEFRLKDLVFLCHVTWLVKCLVWLALPVQQTYLIGLTSWLLGRGVDCDQ